MDKVPVKISENYKPPPRVYQLPQATINKLRLPENYYHEAAQYYYDFQLEQKVLAKMPEWRRLRQKEREARRERKEKREEERLHLLEVQHKKMLGAVSYPSAEELSSSEGDSDEIEQKTKNVSTSHQLGEGVIEPIRATIQAQTGDFHNILKPTILSNSAGNKFCALGTLNTGECPQALVSKVAGAIKEVNTFNYKDFEEDTSSPFDNIELKTINDLDILAQVLHSTQLNTRAKLLEERQQSEDKVEKKQESKENTHKTVVDRTNENIDNSNIDTASLDVIENTKAALQRVDFENISHSANENIPNITTECTSPEAISNNCNYNQPTEFAPNFFNSETQQQIQLQQAYLPYNQIYNGIMEQEHLHQQQQFLNYNLHAATMGNQNYLYATDGGDSHRNPDQGQLTASLGRNANNYLNPLTLANGPVRQQYSNTEHVETDVKSKSVPDILRELSDEVRNSEMRRSRYFSHNSDDGKEGEKQHKNDDVTLKQSATNATVSSKMKNYEKLTAPAQRLAKDISCMGFPLERVAKITQIVGADDKKIIEHLIPLSELIDLGFDETKISEALVKFDNNKEKALEYLIS